MTTRVHRFLGALAALLPLAAVAHEVDCDKTVGLVQVDGNGAPVLGTDMLPIFATTPAATIVVDQYPAFVGWRVRVNNLAPETSFVQTSDDTLLEHGKIDHVFGWLPHPNFGPLAIPVGVSTDAILLQRIDSYEQCIGLPPPANLTASSTFSIPVDDHMCRDGLTNVFTVTTESNIAQCRARIICRPPPAPPPR